jgi:ABC-type uncharacterized transport system permease subunit
VTLTPGVAVKVWKEIGIEVLALVLVLVLVLLLLDDFGAAETLALELGGTAKVLAGPVW